MSEAEKQLTKKYGFFVERAIRGKAACRKCKSECLQGQLRLAKLTVISTGHKLKIWYHVNCMFKQFLQQRLTTKRIDSGDDIDGFDKLSDDDKAFIQFKIDERGKRVTPRNNLKPRSTSPQSQNDNVDLTHRDNSFKQFRVVVAAISNETSILQKTAVVQELLTKGSDGTGFKGDIVLWCKLMLVNEDMRVYHLKDKQLVKLFSRLFGVNRFDMLEHLKQGDIAETIVSFFEKPCRRSQLTIKEVDDYLEQLSKLTKEDEQIPILSLIAGQCTENDLKTFIQLIKHNLGMHAGVKSILDGVHPDAYRAFKNSNDLAAVLHRYFKGETDAKTNDIRLMTPILPMLAEACTSVEQPMKKSPNGMISDYVFADLIVLGAWYGTGTKGGMMSVFLMGCFDPYDQNFRTVTKVHTGHDDKTLERLQGEIKMLKISMDETKVPLWLNCTKRMIPDFVAKCPKNQPVWEITGAAEFTKRDVHTANGITIRFPRVTKIRDDKTWETATNLQELEKLVTNSKENTDVSRLLNGSDWESSASTYKMEE